MTDVGEDQVQVIAAAFELVARDADVGEENGEGSQDAGRLVVARFKQVRQRELGELSRARGNEIDQEQPEPAAGRLPERGEAIAVGVFSSGKERSMLADPGSEKCQNEDKCGERSARDQIVGFGFDAGGLIDRHRQELANDNEQPKQRHRVATCARFLSGPAGLRAVYRMRRRGRRAGLTRPGGVVTLTLRGGAAR